MKSEKYYSVNYTASRSIRLNLADNTVSRSFGDLPKQRRKLIFKKSFAADTAGIINDRAAKCFDDISIQSLLKNPDTWGLTDDEILKFLFDENNRIRLHSMRVCEICMAVAAEMNFSQAGIRQIGLAGLMHDIGKIAISEDLLDKTDSLNAEEFETIKKHSEIGYKMLSAKKGFSEIADYILEHHERWDGKGYPRGIGGDEIHLQARMIAVADAFDAMTSERPYRETNSREEAIAEIRANSGTQFDPAIAEVFAGMFKNIENGC